MVHHSAQIYDFETIDKANKEMFVSCFQNGTENSVDIINMCHKVTGKGYENTHPHLRGPTYGNAGGTEVGSGTHLHQNRETSVTSFKDSVDEDGYLVLEY